MAHPIREVAPGILHWSARHPTIGADVSSYYLTGPRVLLNPVIPPDGLEWFLTGPPPVAVVLTNHHHRRASRDFAERFGIPVRLCREGAERFEDPAVQLEPFDFGDTILDGLTTHHVADSWPDETAIEVPGARALAIADAVIGYTGELSFVPDKYMDDPELERRELHAGLSAIVDSVDFDHLLLAHGDPVLHDGRDRLREFLARSG